MQLVALWLTEPKLLLQVAKSLDDWLTQIAEKKTLSLPTMYKEMLSIYQKN